MHEKKNRKQDLTNEGRINLGRRILRNEVWSVKEMFGKVRSHKGLREIETNEMEIVLTLYIEIPVSRWIKRCWELLRSYREVSTAKCPRWIEGLSRIYWANKNFLDGLRICREAIKTNSQKLRWIKIAITTIEKRSLKGSIDSLAIERYQEAVEIA